MPTYQNTKTYKSGFYNNKVINGLNDRVYTAEDVRKPYDVVFSDGVKPIEDGTAGDTLKVTATSGMTISIGIGHAKVGGAWFENTEPYLITLDAATSATRYDCVIIRKDDNDDVRNAEIYIKSLQSVPTAGNLTRTGKIYEICLAYIKVSAYATSITDADITDTRTGSDLCQTITGVGAVVTKTYRRTYYSESINQTVIPIGISQFDKSKDVLTVIVEGVVFSPNRYSIDNNSQITLNLGLPIVGTRIDFEVVRNVNGSASADATGEYKQLLADVDFNSKCLVNHYYCNGLTDNVNLSKMVQNWLNSGTDYSSMKIEVHGHFGATAPYAGSGTSDSPYQWISLGGGSAKTRKVVVDFSDCSQVKIDCEDNTYNTIVYGLHVDIIGANIIANGVNAQITMFSTVAATYVNAERCRLWVTAKTGYIARGGTFRDCRISFTAEADNAYAFNVLKGGLLRVFGGEHYALAKSGYFSTVIYVNGAQTDTSSGAVITTYSMSCPSITRNGYVQTYAIDCLTNDGRCSFKDTITELSIVANSQNVENTIAQSIAGTL